MKKNTNQIPNEALQLLPWHAKSLLTPKDHSYVQDIVSKYPAFDELVISEREIIRLVNEDKTILDQSALNSTEARLEKVLDIIDNSADQSTSQNTTQKNQSNQDEGFGSSIKNFLSSWLVAPSKPHYASFAIIATVSFALLFAFITPLVNQKSSFQPATSETNDIKNPTTATILLVGINGSPDTLKSFTLLQKQLDKIEVVPGKEGMYRVSLKKKLDSSETKKLIKLLSSQQDLVWFAGEAY